MLTSTPTPVCPQCGSQKLTFLEHGSGVTVFQCEACSRATVQRWEVAPSPAKARLDPEFRFPSWFTGENDSNEPRRPSVTVNTATVTIISEASRRRRILTSAK